MFYVLVSVVLVLNTYYYSVIFIADLKIKLDVRLCKSEYYVRKIYYF